MALRTDGFRSASFSCMVAVGQTPGQTAGACPGFVMWPTDLEKCRQLADAGDTDAMVTLARTYASGISVPKDLHESLRYYTLAADLGDKEALRHLYDAYRWGFDVPKNQARADQYLSKAAQFGSEWAILLLAQAQEKSAPKKALEAYLKLARNDDCIAQLRLAQAYQSGDLVKQNLTQSYFWLLLAGVDAFNRKADVKYDVTSGISYESYIPSGQCSHAVYSLGERIKAEETLSKKLVQAAQDAATNWTKGSIEKLLPPPPPPPQIAADEAGPPDTKSKKPPKVAIASPVEESSPKLAAPPPATAPIASVSPTVPNSSAQYSSPSSRIGVPLKRDAGIFVVPVEINGAITLNFAVDSGAADVSVPADVFSTLVRTGTTKDTDIIGEHTCVLADGSKSQSPTFTIRSLKVGDKVVENVRGSVASAQGTLLLGQSFLERFKSWSINNTSHELVLESFVGAIPTVHSEPAGEVECRSVGAHLNGEPVSILRRARVQGDQLHLSGMTGSTPAPERVLSCTALQAGIWCEHEFGPVTVTVMTNGNRMIETLTDPQTRKEVAGAAYICDAELKLETPPTKQGEATPPTPHKTTGPTPKNGYVTRLMDRPSHVRGELALRH